MYTQQNQAQYTSEYEQQVISELKHLDVLRAVNQVPGAHTCPLAMAR